MSKSPEKQKTLLTFPCDFIIKVLGKGGEDFEAAVLMIIHKHVPNFSDTAIQTRDSETGKYRALTVTVHVDSQEQLDNIYFDLSSSPHVIMAL